MDYQNNTDRLGGPAVLALSLWAPVALVVLLAAVPNTSFPRAQQKSSACRRTRRWRLMAQVVSRTALGDGVLRISAARGQVAVAPSADQIANHSYPHSDFQPPTEQEISDELNSTSDLIRALMGDDCYFSEYFHFPRGRSNCFAMGEVREHGFGVADFSSYLVQVIRAIRGGYVVTRLLPPSGAVWGHVDE
jgi:hypothetical protein